MLAESCKRSAAPHSEAIFHQLASSVTALLNDNERPNAAPLRSSTATTQRQPLPGPTPPRTRN